MWDGRVSGDGPTQKRPAKGSAAAWRRAHWPLFDAIMREDTAAFNRLAGERMARNEVFDGRVVFCIECHGLMIHLADGWFQCPYQRAGIHDHARTAMEVSDTNGDHVCEAI